MKIRFTPASIGIEVRCTNCDKYNKNVFEPEFVLDDGSVLELGQDGCYGEFGSIYICQACKDSLEIENESNLFK